MGTGLRGGSADTTNMDTGLQGDSADMTKVETGKICLFNKRGDMIARGGYLLK